MATKSQKKGLDTMESPSPAAMEAFVQGGAVPTPVAAKAPEAAKPAPLAAAPIEDEEPTQRLTLEIPLSLHVTIKSGCALRRTKIKAEVMALLESHYRSGDTPA